MVAAYPGSSPHCKFAFFLGFEEALHPTDTVSVGQQAYLSTHLHTCDTIDPIHVHVRPILHRIHVVFRWNPLRLSSHIKLATTKSPEHLRETKEATPSTHTHRIENERAREGSSERSRKRQTRDQLGSRESSRTLDWIVTFERRCYIYTVHEQDTPLTKGKIVYLRYIRTRR